MRGQSSEVLVVRRRLYRAFWRVRLLSRGYRADTQIFADRPAAGGRNGAGLESPFRGSTADRTLVKAVKLIVQVDSAFELNFYWQRSVAGPAGPVLNFLRVCLGVVDRRSWVLVTSRSPEAAGRAAANQP